MKLKVYETLKTSILNFQLLPGVKLSDKFIAQEMGISRTPVKDALIRLSEQSLVEAHHNRGYTVKSFKIEEVYNLYTVRETLEILAIRQATPNLDKEKEKELREPVDRYPSLVKSNNLVGMIDSDEKFHNLIALYSENTTLINILNNINYQIRIARRYDHLHGDNTQMNYEEHLKIIDFMTFSYPQMFIYASDLYDELAGSFREPMTLSEAVFFQKFLARFDRAGFGNDMIIVLEKSV